MTDSETIARLMNELAAERAESKLWFEKAQEWRHQNARLRSLIAQMHGALESLLVAAVEVGGLPEYGQILVARKALAAHDKLMGGRSLQAISAKMGITAPASLTIPE